MGRGMSLLGWSLAWGILVASISSNFIWVSICSTSSLMLAVSSLSLGAGEFYTAGVKIGNGIWLRSLREESSGTPIACKAANQPASKPSLRAWFMTGSAEFSMSANPSLYHFSSQASKAALRLASSSTWVVFRLAALANFRSISFCFAKSSADLYFTSTLAFSAATAFFLVVSAAFIFSFVILTAVSLAAFSGSASSESSFKCPSRMWVSWVA